MEKHTMIDLSNPLKPLNNEIIEKFNLNDYEIGEKLCKLPNGYISIAKKIKTNQLFSIKVLRKSELVLQRKFIEHELNRYQNLLYIYHPFIIEIKAINNTDPYNLFYLTEFIAGVNLKSLIKTNEKLPLEHSRFYLASLITILDYLHKKKIIYRDLRPDLIFINTNGYIKLIDFSFSKKIKNDYTYTLCGIREYYSPEMINQTGYNKSIDFWQLGILLYEMLVGYPPFLDSDPVQLFNKIRNCKIIFPKKINKNAKSIIRHFLTVDTSKRLGCTKKGIYEIIQTPFFEGFDWEGLLHRNLEPPFIPKINHIYLSHYKKIDDIHIEDNNIAVSKDKDPFYNW